MKNDFLRVKDRDFYMGEEKVILRGYGLGSLLNLEHFMISIPGTDFQIRSAITNAFGRKKADQFWGRYYRAMINEADFKYFKQLGINAIRIPFNYRLFENDQNPYIYIETGFSEIDRILDLCEKHEIWAILDLHAAPGGQNPDWHSDNAIGESLLWEHADFRRRTIALWKHIARRYASNRWIAAYDLINEPVLMIPNKGLLNQFFAELIQEIRTIDQNHILFVEGDMYATRFEMFEPFEDPNVALSFHFYPFLHHDISTKPTQKERIEEELFIDVGLADIIDRLNRPVWCGETGALFNHADRKHQESMLEDILEIFEERGISWSLWAYKDARSMGTLHPKADSAWMSFSRLASQGWNFWEEFGKREYYETEALKKYAIEIPELERRKIGFRILANHQLILKERYSKLFKEIPFEVLLSYLDSFKFDNCEIWEEVSSLVMKYTRQIQT
jgi:endoglucanase